MRVTPLCPRASRACARGWSFASRIFQTTRFWKKWNARPNIDLLGLFRGQGLTEREHLAQTGDQPNMIWLYRRPIIDFWADGEETLAEIVTHVLVHEIGHHFGLSDQDMEEIESHVG